MIVAKRWRNGSNLCTEITVDEDIGGFDITVYICWFGVLMNIFQPASSI
jgi:hypothetical protein